MFPEVTLQPIHATFVEELFVDTCVEWLYNVNTMRAFNYEFTIHKVTPDGEMKDAILSKAETNAKAGLVQAKLELRHHELLLEQCGLRLPATEEAKTELEREIRLTTEAVERDKKTINNWETQLRAIEYERK